MEQSRTEVILRRLLEGMPVYPDDRAAALKKAIVCVRLQEPRKPIKKTYGRKCPHCLGPLAPLDYHCQLCGQKIERHRWIKEDG